MCTEFSHHRLSKNRPSCHLLIWLDIWFGSVLCTHIHISRRSKIFSSSSFLCNRFDISWAKYRDVCVWTTCSTVTDYHRIACHFSYLSGFSIARLLSCSGSFSPNVEKEKEEDKYQTETSQKGQDSNEKHASFYWRSVLDCSVWKTPVFTVITRACTVSSLGDLVLSIHLVSNSG